MDLFEKMATFVRVVDAGSFSAAAKQLRLSSAAVGRQIATLEESIGVELLIRSTRRMAVTPAGRTYYERCLQILRDVEAAQGVGRGSSVDGLLLVSAPVTFGLARVVPEIHDLMIANPGLRIDLRLEDRITDLALDGVDVAIRVGVLPPDRTDVIAHRLFSFPRVMVASPGYLKKRGEPKTPEALVKHDWLSHTQGVVADVCILNNGAREARVRMKVGFRTNAFHALRELALSGAGVALLPDWFVEQDREPRALKRILPAWQSEPVAVHAIHRTGQRGAQRVRAFVDHLRAAYRE